MGYYMRYFSTDNQDITLPWLEEAPKRVNPRYSIDHDTRRDKDRGLLFLAGDNYGQFEINRPGDGLFEGEIEEFLEGIDALDVVEAGRREGRETVRGTLERAKCILALQVFFEGRETGATFEGISPLWKLLFEARAGLLQADGEGFYRGTELVFASG